MPSVDAIEWVPSVDAIEWVPSVDAIEWMPFPLQLSLVAQAYHSSECESSGQQLNSLQLW